MAEQNYSKYSTNIRLVLPREPGISQSLNCRGWKGPQETIEHKAPAKGGSLQDVTQVGIQMGFEHLHRRRVHKLSLHFHTWHLRTEQQSHWTELRSTAPPTHHFTFIYTEFPLPFSCLVAHPTRAPFVTSLLSLYSTLFNNCNEKQRPQQRFMLNSSGTGYLLLPFTVHPLLFSFPSNKH